MNESEFWSLIERARDLAVTPDKLATCFVNQLNEMSVSAIVDFGRHFRNANRAAYDERLWAAAIAISEHYTSDDTFSDFCDWLVAQGRLVYDKVLTDPDSLVELEEIESGSALGGEGFAIASAAYETYKMKTGRDNFSEMLGLLPPPELRNAGIWDGRFETLKQIVPRLYAKFGARP